MVFFDKQGLAFKCTKCGTCCRGEPGYVMLSPDDIARMSSFLRLDQSSFIRQYCRPVRRTGGVYVSLIEKENYDCIFWDNGCTIYQGRPLQCSSYPFWRSIVSSKESWDREHGFCPGVGKGSPFSAQTIHDFLHRRLQEPYVLWESVSEQM